MGKPGSCGYDDTFLVSRFQPWKKEDHPVASLSSTLSGIKVELYTDQEALHVHTWNNKPGVFLYCSPTNPLELGSSN